MFSDTLKPVVRINTKIIYENSACCVEFFYDPSGINDRVAFVFSSGGNRELVGNNFGGNFLSKNGFDIVAFKVINDDWFQNIPEFIFEEIERLISIRNYRERVALGTSMGGYGALVFSKSLMVDKVLVYCPQYRIDQHFDYRWQDCANKIVWRYRIDSESIRQECKYHFLYDSKSTDSLHFELIKNFIPSAKLGYTCIPYVGHEIVHYLHETNQLNQLALDFFNDVDIKAFTLLRHRRNSSIYLSNIYKELISRKKEKLALKLLNFSKKNHPTESKVRNLIPITDNSLEERRLKIVIPFYKNSHLVSTLFKSLLGCIAEIKFFNSELILINDSPLDNELSKELEKCKKNNLGINVRIINNSENLGYLESVNQGLKIALESNDDVLLVNSDAYIFPGAIKELYEVAYSDPMIGFVSPRSNNATLCTLPIFRGLMDSPIAYYKDFLLLKKYFPRISYVPTGVGFCLLIKADVLRNFGLFDLAYSPGYNEENDLVMRANRYGYRAALANHAFVWHKGSESFGIDRARSLSLKNDALLIKRYPEYQPLVERYFDSPEFRAEKIIGGLLPNTFGKFTIYFDCTNLGAYFNGTSVAAKELIFAAADEWPSNIRIKVMTSLDSWNFHKFSENIRLEWLNPSLVQEPMGAVVRIGQPFFSADIARLISSAPVVACFMLDAIADDCGELSLKFDINLWRFVMNSFDIVFTNSRFTAQQLRNRYLIGPDTTLFPSLHSTTPSEYSESNNPVLSEAYVYDILLIGNNFTHKGVLPCLNLLANSFTDLKIAVMASSKVKMGNVSYLPVGNLSNHEISLLYRESKIAIFPSHYEGFGLPLMSCIAAQKPIFVRLLPPFIEIASNITKGIENIYWFSDDRDLVIQLSKGLPIWKGGVSDGEKSGWKRSANEVLEQLLISAHDVNLNKVANRMRLFELSFKTLLPTHNLKETNVAIQVLIPIISIVLNKLFKYQFVRNSSKKIYKWLPF
jgi:GT2 family glycosyltransferase